MKNEPHFEKSDVDFNERIAACRNSEGGHMLDVIFRHQIGDLCKY